MRLTELYDQNYDGVELDFTSAQYTNNSDELTYRVSDLKVGGRVVEDAGIVILNIEPIEFVEELESKLGDNIQSIDGINQFKPLHGVKCSEVECSSGFEMSTPYTLDVNYTNSSGESDVVEVTFRGSTFIPSNSMRGVR